MRDTRMAMEMICEEYRALAHVDGMGASAIRLNMGAMAINPDRIADVDRLLGHINDVRDEFIEVASALAMDGGLEVATQDPVSLAPRGRRP